MGDRAVVHFVGDRVGSQEISPAIYLHWQGYKVQELLRETFELMRTRGPDVPYTAARFIGICHTHSEGNLSLGTWNAPDGGLAALRERDYSHGDAGVFIVHCSRSGWEIEMRGGYGFHESADSDLQRPRVLWHWQDPAADLALSAGASVVRESL
jgi:hypothetical protein